MAELNLWLPNEELDGDSIPMHGLASDGSLRSHSSRKDIKDDPMHRFASDGSLRGSHRDVRDDRMRRFASDGSLRGSHKDDKDEQATIAPEPSVPHSISYNATPVTFRQLFRFATRSELLLDLLGLVAAAGAGASQPMMSLLFGNLTQEFVVFGLTLEGAEFGDPRSKAFLPTAAENFRRKAALDASYVIYIGLGMFICTFTYMSIWVYTGEVGAKRLRERYLGAILRQDIAFFDHVGAGEVATRIQTDTHLVQLGISEKVAMVVMYLSAFATGYILAFIRSWRLSLALSAILPCIIIAGTFMNKYMSKYTQRSLQHVAEGGSQAEEVISTVRTAQAFGTQSTLANIYDTHVDLSKKADRQAAVMQGAGLGVFFFIIYSAYSLAFTFGTTLINAGHAEAGSVVNVFLAVLTGSLSLAMLAPEMQAITHARGAASKLYETIDHVPSIDSADSGGLKLENVEGHITFENVKFRYPSRPNVPIFQDLSITFPVGKTAALVGASGSGKSSIIALVERFYDPLSGIIKLDGVDLKELNVKWLRTQIGLVSQEPTLFSTSIKENVSHGLIGTEYENATDEEKFTLIKEACVKANADQFITSMPLGYDTLVGERGFLMSGGQKQRIAIARAIVSNPRILLLDEATSALDTQSEGIVQDALDKASNGRTTITVAHRLSTIKDADCIYVMGDGLVLEQGTHGELLSNENGHYSRLVTAQKLRDKREVEVDIDNSDNITAATDKVEDVENETADVASLGRKNSCSIASKIIEDRKNGLAGGKNKTHSLFYLFKRMGKLNRDGWLHYLVGTLAAILNGMVYPSYGVVFSKGIAAFSEVNHHERRHDGDRVALWLFLIAVASMVIIAIQNYMFASTAANLTAKLRSLSFRAILRQDIAFFDEEENSTGSLTSNLSENPQKVNGLAGITLGTIVQSVSTLVSGSVLGLVFAWKLGLVAMSCMPVVVSTGYIRLRVVRMKDETNKKAHESSALLACEAAGSIRTVASLTRENDFLQLYSQSLEEPLRQSNRSGMWSNLLFAFSQSVSFYVIGLVFWYGARLVSFFEISTFAFFVTLMSATFGSIQAGGVFTYVPDISSAKGAGSDIIKLLDSVPEIDAESTEGKKVPVESTHGQIRFQDIHFRYPTRPGVRVLRGLSFKIEPGTYVALVGASGSGKSTVIQLIERFYDPLAGQIYLDNELISELNIQEYRKHIALVSQEPTLYAGTIRFNILLGATKPESDVTQEEIVQACRDANILDFINSLPDGFDTEVGGKGSQLSGGQKQRIAIARALLRNPKVLLLDEATSALDSASEKIVQEALDHAAKGRTTIAIAHRLSTIQNADCIYFIKDGNVCESGTHDELLHQRGEYYAYVQLQALTNN